MLAYALPSGTACTKGWRLGAVQPPQSCDLRLQLASASPPSRRYGYRDIQQCPACRYSTGMAAGASARGQRGWRPCRQNAAVAALLACALLLCGARNAAAQSNSDPLAGNAGSDGVLMRSPPG